MRASFEKHYDETGRNLGFVPGAYWLSWENPEFRPANSAGAKFVERPQR